MLDRTSTVAASEPPSPIIIEGTIKWFEPSKSYGFIVRDDGKGDVLLHVTVLRKKGYQTAYEGTKVICEAIERAKGFQALRILSMDETTAVIPEQSATPKRPSLCGVQAITSVGMFERVTCKWYNRPRGFGFLTRGKDTADIFVHAETLSGSGMIELLPAQVVMARYGKGAKGLMATEIKPAP